MCAGVDRSGRGCHPSAGAAQAGRCVTAPTSRPSRARTPAL